MHHDNKRLLSFAVSKYRTIILPLQAGGGRVRESLPDGSGDATGAKERNCRSFVPKILGYRNETAETKLGGIGKGLKKARPY
jgi:hypothetical protein